MARYLLHVYTRAVEGQEAAYHEWYDNTHLADVLTVEGFVAAERLQPEPLSPEQKLEGFLAVYEIETDDPAGVMARLNTASEGGMELSPALDMSNLRLELYRQITPRLSKVS